MNFISRFPASTKLIFMGAVIGVVIAIPVILSLGPDSEGDGEPALAEETVVEQPESQLPDGSGAAIEVTLEPEESAAPPAQAVAETVVSGTMLEDTTWSPDRSEAYVITSTLIVAEGVTLTIEPGTVIRAENTEDMFVLDGAIIAHGTPENPIVFDGGGNSSFFTRKNPNTDAFLDLDYATIKNGIKFWRSVGDGQFGAFSLKNVQLSNISGVSELWYPDGDVHIENCTFENTGGFSIVQRNGTKVYVENNTFRGKNPDLPSEDAGFWIRSRGSFNQAETIIRYNSFSPEDGIAVKLDSGEDARAIIATQNYWGTDDASTIEAMIWDGSDDPGVAGSVQYDPFLTSPPETAAP